MCKESIWSLHVDIEPYGDDCLEITVRTEPMPGGATVFDDPHPFWRLSEAVAQRNGVCRFVVADNEITRAIYRFLARPPGRCGSVDWRWYRSSVIKILEELTD